MRVSGTQSGILGARCIVSLMSDLDSIRFLVGTSALSGPKNRVHIFDFASTAVANNALTEVCAIEHPDEVIDISPHPKPSSNIDAPKQEIIATIGAGKVRILTMATASNDREDENHAKGLDFGSLESMFCVDLPGRARSVEWCSQDGVLCSSTSSVTYLRMREAHIEQQEVCRVAADNISIARSDPRSNEDQIAVANAKHVQIIDRRIASSSFSDSHSKPAALLACARTLDLDFNPNRRNLLATGGEHGQVQIWDLRRPEDPVMRYCGHSHWVRSVRYNPLHDDLLLSGGTDGVVHLWRSSNSVESEPDEGIYQPACAFPEHDDSVYGVAWSSTDEFAFASISHDGRVAANFVPFDLKNDILLS